MEKVLAAAIGAACIWLTYMGCIKLFSSDFFTKHEDNQGCLRIVCFIIGIPLVAVFIGLIITSIGSCMGH